MIFSKHFGGNKEGAIWDTAFLDDRGFEEDTLLLRNLMDNKLDFRQLASFDLPRLTTDEMERMLKNDCFEFDMFDEKKHFRTEILNTTNKILKCAKNLLTSASSA